MCFFHLFPKFKWESLFSYFVAHRCSRTFQYFVLHERDRKKITARNTLGHINCDNCQGKVLGNMAAFLRELKMAKTYFIIVVLAFVCFLPTGIVLFGFKEPWDESEKERGAITPAHAWTNTLVAMNSTLNCLIFFWANKHLRKEAVKLVKNFFSRGN